jgi:hypothetical protein
MATTTNYGWTTPDDTALVKDGAAAIRTLGSSVDTTTKNLNPETTLGDIAYRSSTANVKTRLGIGTSGQILTVSGGVPAWTTPAGGGKVLQVVQATYSTTVSSSSASYATTGLSCSITPTSATSSVLVLYSVAGVQKSNANLNTGMAMKLKRGGTDIHLLGTDMLYTATAIVNYGTTAASSYLDSPATTSATTYEVFFANLNALGSVSVQVSGASSVSTMILLEIGA